MRAIPLLAVLALAGSGPAQDIVWAQPGGTNLQIWPALAVVDDVDGDGYEDLVHSAERWDGVMPYHWWSTLWRSGRDGSILREVITWSPGSGWYRSYASCGDLDGDGVRDFAGHRYRNQSILAVDAVSARTGSTLWTQTGRFADEFGHKLAGGADVNGDGRRDLIVSSRRENNDQGAVHLFAHDGSPLYSIHGLQASSVGALGDIDGDGYDDFVFGANDRLLGFGVHVHSGRTGSRIRFTPDAIDFIGSGTASGCGDVDGDGVPDYFGSSGVVNVGAAAVYSGRTGQQLWVWRYAPWHGFGDHTATGDMDRDGVPDFLVGHIEQGQSGVAVVSVFSGRDGTLLATLRGANPGPGRRGIGIDAFAVGAPRPGDVFPIVAGIEEYPGTPWPNGNGLNMVTVQRCVPTGVRAFGGACAGPLGKAPGIGFRVLDASRARIHLSGAPAGATAYLLLGLSDRQHGAHRLPLALDRWGMPGCALRVSIDVQVRVVAGTTGNARGYAYVDVPRAGGTPLYAQWLVLGNGPVAVEPGVPEPLPAAVSEGLVF